MVPPPALHRPSLSPLLRRRLLTVIPAFAAVVTRTFAVVRAAPGGPFGAERMLPEAVRANVEQRFGLDRPIVDQYLRFWAGVLTADLGPSFEQPERGAVAVLLSGAGPSLLLGGAALLIALLLGVGGGTLAVRYPAAGRLVAGGALLALALPVFVLGPLLIQVFAVGLGWLPPALWGSPANLVLPALTLGLPVGGAMARFWRPTLSAQLADPA